MKKEFLLIAVFLLCYLPSHTYASEDLSLDLAENHIDITTGFTGGTVVVFGTKESKGEIAVILEGSRHDVVIRRKNRVFGAWINRSSLKFSNVPLYYDYALSVENEEMLMKPAQLKKYNLGMQALLFTPEKDGDKPEVIKKFQKAFVQERQRKGFFPTSPHPVEFIDDHFFKVRMDVPANIPTGKYIVRALLIRDGKIVQEKQKKLNVAQVGFNSSVYNFSKNHSFTYALFCVLIAALSGWVSNKVTRKG